MAGVGSGGKLDLSGEEGGEGGGGERAVEAGLVRSWGLRAV
jgi:hypothetical protein